MVMSRPVPRLFPPGELVCTGADSDTAFIRPLEACVADAHLVEVRGAIAPLPASYALRTPQPNRSATLTLTAVFSDLQSPRIDPGTILGHARLIECGIRFRREWDNREGSEPRNALEPVTLGGRPGYAWETFNGTLDDVRIYHRALSAGEVAGLSNLVDWAYDSDGDGIPDYLEDRNGNGSADSGETDWQQSEYGTTGVPGLQVFPPLE